MFFFACLSHTRMVYISYAINKNGKKPPAVWNCCSNEIHLDNSSWFLEVIWVNRTFLKKNEDNWLGCNFAFLLTSLCLITFSMLAEFVSFDLQAPCSCSVEAHIFCSSHRLDLCVILCPHHYMCEYFQILWLNISVNLYISFIVLL